MNHSSCYQVTVKDYHPNPFCIACYYYVLKISLVPTQQLFLGPALGKIQTRKIHKKKKKKKEEVKSVFMPDHFG